jgi:nucleoside phosphorylase
MNPKDITLLVWDDPINFNKPKTKMSLGNNKLYDLKQFYSEEEFSKTLDSLEDNALLVLCCHVNYENFESYFNFINSSLIEDYKLSHLVNYVSSFDSGEAMKKLHVEHGIQEKIIKYHDLKQGIKADDIKPFTKSELLGSPKIEIEEQKTKTKEQFYPQCDYVIITALEEDEMTTVLPMLIKEGRVDDDKKLIEFGSLASNTTKKIAYASQPQTGMVDASILATEMMIKFRPRFLIMAGVLGGKPGEVGIGDIIVSNKVFTIDKGKITDEQLKMEIESKSMDSSYIQSFIRDKTKIERFIEDSDNTRDKKPAIHFGPVACVRQVIDKKEFFEDKILSVDRKAVGLEMESYGIARACEIVNNGKVIPLIIKSAMDNTVQKVDDAKRYAASTSATFVKYILENDLI